MDKDINYRVTWLSDNNLQQVYDLDILLFNNTNYAFNKNDIQSFTKSSVNLGKVIEDNYGFVQGFLLYRNFPYDKAKELCKIGVRPEFQRKGIGSLLLDQIKLQLNQHRFRIEAIVEDNLYIPISFLEKNGFRSIYNLPDEKSQVYVFIKGIKFYL